MGEVRGSRETLRDYVFTLRVYPENGGVLLKYYHPLVDSLASDGVEDNANFALVFCFVLGCHVRQSQAKFCFSKSDFFPVFLKTRKIYTVSIEVVSFTVVSSFCSTSLMPYAIDATFSV